MQKEGYDIKIAARNWTSVFYSEGPKGSIKKVIQYTPYSISGEVCFNLCFGDWNTEMKLVDDKTLNNSRRRPIPSPSQQRSHNLIIPVTAYFIHRFIIGRKTRSTAQFLYGDHCIGFTF